MRTSYRCRCLFLTLTALLAVSAAARAQLAQSFVSGAGDDGNPCTRALPCKTFAAAFPSTAPGGTITVLDPGSFGTLVITHAITIEGHGLGLIQAGGAANGITIQAGSADAVVLDGLTLDGGKIAEGDGISVASVGSLVITSCTIKNFRGDGVHDLATNTSSRSNTPHSLRIADTTVSGNAGVGVSIASVIVTPPLLASLEKVTLTRNAEGGFLLATTGQAGAAADRAGEPSPEAKTYNASHSNTANICCGSVLSGNGGFGGAEALDATVGAQLQSFLFVQDSTIFGNTGSGLTALGQGVIVMSNLKIYGNSVGMSAPISGQLVSFGNNSSLGNAIGGNPNVKVTLN